MSERHRSAPGRRLGGVAGFHRLQTLLVERGQRVIVIDPYRLSVDSARVVGHAHGAGVALRLAASYPRRVSALYFPDVGALAANRTKVFSASLRLLPYIVRIPGAQFLKRLRQNAAHQEWLDSATQRR